jgi:hypothetical protein
MKYPDVSVRCLALQLLGKKARIHSRNLSTIVQNASEKSSKVKKTVVDVLGNYGKLNTAQLSSILDHTNFDEISVATWKSLSLAWNILIPCAGDPVSVGKDLTSKEGGSRTEQKNSDSE